MHRVQNALVSNKGRGGKRRVVGERRGGGEVEEEGGADGREEGEEGWEEEVKGREGGGGRRGGETEKKGSQGEGLVDISVGPITRNALSRALLVSQLQIARLEILTKKQST